MQYQLCLLIYKSFYQISDDLFFFIFYTFFYRNHVFLLNKIFKINLQFKCHLIYNTQFVVFALKPPKKILVFLS